MCQEEIERNESFNKDLSQTYEGLWEVYEVAACLRDLCQQVPTGNEATISADGVRGLGRIMEMCAQRTIDAVGIVPWKECERKTA